MVELLREFTDWLGMERGASPNTVASYSSDLGKYVEFLASAGKPDASSAENQDVYAYLSFLSECGMCPSSIRREISSIRAFHHFLVAEGHSTKDPTVRVVLPKVWRRVPKALTVPQVEKLLAEPKAGVPLELRDKALLEFTYATGMRVSEVIGFKTRDLAFETATARCLGKGSRERVIPVGSIAIKWIETYLRDVRPKLVRGADPEVLFLNWRGKRLTRMGYWKILAKYVRRAAIPAKVTPHVFRHSFATHLLEGGASLRDVQQLLGHKSISTTQIYTKVDMEYLREVIVEFHPRGRLVEGHAHKARGAE